MKGLTHMARRNVEKRFGLDKERVLLACGDGTTYVVERGADQPANRFRPVERIESDGERVGAPRTVPACVEREIARFIRHG